MTALEKLITETAELLQGADEVEARAAKRGRKLPPTDGRQWRALAACKRELGILQAKAALLDAVFQHTLTDPDEIERRYCALRALEVVDQANSPAAPAKEGA